MVDEGCRYISKLSSARGSLYGANLSSTQQMRKSIQAQFKLVLHPSSSYATPALCILLGCWGLRRPPVLLVQRLYTSRETTHPLPTPLACAKLPSETPPNCQTKMRQTTKRLLLHTGPRICPIKLLRTCSSLARSLIPGR